MGSGYYAAYTGLLARTEALDATASNLANANTNGFRAELDYFRNAVAGPEAADSQLNSTVNDYGVMGGSQLDLGQGALVPTGNPLDLAIEGAGFFSIQTPQGIRYTRDGQFQRSQSGLLTTTHGEPVLDAQNKPIVVPTGAISIGGDGILSVDGNAAGTLGLFNFPAAASMQAEGNGQYAAPKGQAPVASTATVKQGSLEGSNQDVIHGTLQMVLVQRQAEMMQKALTIFNSDFDKTATEDLPKA